MLGHNSQPPAKVADLITGTVSRTEDGWLVLWWGDGATPGELTAPSLTEATSQASSAVAALYAASQPLPGAVLQFAIYPWDDSGEAALIYDISGGPGRFIARDMQGSERVLEGGALEDLVRRAEELPEAMTSMFRWIRPVAELPIAE